ncbi:L-serine ammonia-lyase, iron-sulfur-dependent, subunit alpha [Bacteroidota bacterium]
MRGPSASHCAASVRIGRIARDLMSGNIRKVLIEFDRSGSLATTHETQGSDIGLFAGILGWDITDERLAESKHFLDEAGIGVEINISDLKADHPNTYKLTLANEDESHSITALSTGGGIIEVIEIDDFKLSIAGDYYETIIFTSAPDAVKFINDKFKYSEIIVLQAGEKFLVEIKSQSFVSENDKQELSEKYKVHIKQLSPVLPILSREGLNVPFLTADEMTAYNLDKNLSLWELALIYESGRGGITKEKVFDMMKEIVNIIIDSAEKGIAGTKYEDRILGWQSGNYKKEFNTGKLFGDGLLNQIILSVTALMEMKSSMGLIVAAPTAGSCGGLPGTVIGAGNELKLSQDEMTRAMLAAGMIGIFIAHKSTFAAEVCGCQAECGAGSGMAAAALVTIKGGTTQQALDAASMALQNILGMTCDPVANRVEVPCLGKNVMAAVNALSCANMALAGFDKVIPLDEVIETMDVVGKSLPRELRCTALGGLSITSSSKEIEKKLNKK